MADNLHLAPSGDTDELAADMSILQEGADDNAPPVEGEEGLDEAPSPDEEEEPKPDEEEEEPKPEDKEEDENEEEGKKPEVVRPITHHRPTVKEITTKYPNFFKEFPDMKHAMFREQEYSSLFPTVDEAKEAQADANSFKQFSNLVTSGKAEDFQEFLKGVAEVQGLDSMAINFLPSLYKTNRDLYFEITQPIASSLLKNAYRNGVAGNDNLKNAALVLAQWAFGDPAFAVDKNPEVRNLEKPIDPELEKQKTEFATQKYNDTRTYVADSGRTRLKAEIARGFDPNNAFPEYTRNLLINQVIEEVGDALEKDQRHMSAINGLWKKAHAAGFAGDWKDRILSTYLSGARAVMPAIRSRIRAAAMKDAQSGALETEQRARKSSDRREVRGQNGPPQNGRTRTPSAREVDWGQTSDLDFLNDRIKLRK